MIFIFGPLYSGKRTFAASLLGCDMDALSRRAVWDVQELAARSDNLDALADELSRYDAVIATETGGGVIPADAAERRARENAGRLNCLLAERATAVIRVFCGLPLVIKGQLPNAANFIGLTPLNPPLPKIKRSPVPEREGGQGEGFLS